MALNDLDVLSADIQNAHLTASIEEKYCIVASEEMELAESMWERPANIVRAMYGLLYF